MSEDPAVNEFPLASRVILHGLIQAPDLNGKLGIVRSALNDAGRYSVFIPDDNRTVGLKPSNLKYEPRTVESLSIKELKLILKSKQVDDVEYSGVDKAELRKKVSEVVTDEAEISPLLAKAQTTTNATSSCTNTSTSASNVPVSSTTAQQAADQLSNMSPESLRQQAQMMRSMDPATIRRMNPQLANMSDAQIRMAADQMEMMANNPAMMKMAVDQMKNMDPAELQRVQSQMQNGTMPTMATPPTAASPGKGGASSNVSNGPPVDGDTAKMLANMDKDQFKQMIQMVKDNPEMLKQFAAMTGTSEEQIKQGMEAFAGMSDAKMDAALKMMQTVAKAKDKWNQADAKTGGNLLKILVAAAVLIVGLLGWYFFFRSSSAVDPSLSGQSLMEDVPKVSIHVAEEDEFATSEF